MSDASYVVMDFETSPLPDEELKAIYRESTYEEFAAKCNKNWKPETVASKYEESKVTGWQDFVEKAALSPLTGCIVAAGFASEVDGNLQPRILTGPEQAILSSVWQAIEQALEAGIPIIGHNIEGFDLPFLIRRSWKHGIDTIDRSKIFRGRYLCGGFVDTQTEFLKGTGDRYISLDAIAQFFGVGGKPEESHMIEWEGVERLLSGEHFWRYFRDTEENRKRAISYLTNDLAMTARVAKRMQLA